MDFSGGNPGEAPPGYAEHANVSNVPYGQSRLLHGNEATGPPNKPSVPPSGPAPYPAQPGYVPYGAPPYGYPMNPGYPPPRYAEAAAPQHQQQSVVVVTGPE